MATATALTPEARHRELLMAGVIRAGVLSPRHELADSRRAEPSGLDPQTRHEMLTRLGVLDDDVDAVAAGIGMFVESRAYDPKQLRIPAGHKGGGRWRKLADRVFEALQAWEKGEGPDDPFADVLDTDPVKRREQIRRIATKELGLTLRRGTSYEEIAKAVLDDIRGGVKAKRQEKKDTLRLVPEGKPKGLDPTRLSGPPGPDRPQVLDRDGVRRDVMVIASKDGRRVGLSTVDSTTGERVEDVTRQPDMAALRRWAVEHDYPDLAAWVDKHVPADKMGGEKTSAAKPGGLDNGTTDALAELADENGLDPKGTREELLTRLRKAGVKAPPEWAEDYVSPLTRPSGKPAGPDAGDLRLLREIETKGYATAGGVTTGREWQRTDRLDMLKRRGLVNKSGGWYTLTDAGREFLAADKMGGEKTSAAVPKKAVTTNVDDLVDQIRDLRDEDDADAALADASVADLREVADRFNVTLPPKVRGKAAIRLHIAQSVTGHNRRAGGRGAPAGGLAKGVALDRLDGEQGGLLAAFMVRPGDQVKVGEQWHTVEDTGWSGNTVLLYSSADRHDRSTLIVQHPAQSGIPTMRHDWEGETPDVVPAAPAKATKKAAPKPDGGLTADVDTLRRLGDPEVIRDELDLKKVPELKELAGHLGVAKSGRKRDLVDRLVDGIAPSAPGGLSANPMVRAVQVDNRVREAYATVLARQGGASDWVMLSDLRDELGETLNRTEVDEALRRLEREQGVNIVPQSNQKALTQADIDAAVTIGDQQKHAITIADPSPRPLPGAAPGTRAPGATARATATLDRLAADLATIPDADRRVGGVATPNELVAQWRRQLDSGELTPDALPELFERMTVRYATAEGDPVGEAFADAATALRTPVARAPHRAVGASPDVPVFSWPARMDTEAAGALRDHLRLDAPEGYTLRGAWTQVASDYQTDEVKRLVDRLGRPAALRVAREADVDNSLRRFVQMQRPHDPDADPLADLPPVTDAELDAVRQRAVGYLRDEFRGRPVHIRMRDSDLAAALRDGRVKTALETGRSGGLGGSTRAYRELRTEREEMLFGISRDAGPERRPVYGYVDIDGGGGSSRLDQFGDIQVVLKDSVRSRTTVSEGDSIDEDVLPSPIDNPRAESFNGGLHGGRSGEAAWAPVDWSHTYTYPEAHIHGGVTVDDIDEVVLPPEPSVALRQLLDSKGVRYRVAGASGGAPTVDVQQTLAGMAGLTVRQKRARLRALGLPEDQINQLVPTASKARKVTRSADDEPDDDGGDDFEDEDDNLDDGDDDGPEDDFEVLYPAREAARAVDPEAEARHRALLMAGVIRADEREDLCNGGEPTEQETRALGNQLKHYWTKDPEGLAKWATKPHPYTALYRHLVKYVGSARAKRIAAQWFKAVFKIWPGERFGDNPVGPG